MGQKLILFEEPTTKRRIFFLVKIFLPRNEIMFNLFLILLYHRGWDLIKNAIQKVFII